MPSYPAKPYIVPHDDWFNNKSSDSENKSKAKEIKNISTIHEFFYRQANVKIGGSDSLIKTTLEKKSSSKVIISSLQNSDRVIMSRSEEKYKSSKIPKELKSIKKRSIQDKTFYRNLSNKNKFNIRSYLLDLKSFLTKIISRKK
tara:strand:+ start:761 stop:1192 length:432 start_codon:yes stop_codon:yes gene_type:complete